MNVNLISVDLDEPSSDWQRNIRLAISATNKRLYVYFEGTSKRKLSLNMLIVKHYEDRMQENQPMKHLMLDCLPCWHVTTTK